MRSTFEDPGDGQANRVAAFEPLEERLLLAVLSVPGEYLTIQQAVSAAEFGDIVDVAPGTYPENLLIDKPGITLQGAGPRQSIIDGQKSGTVIIVKDTDSTVRITGFTIRNGYGDSYYRAGGIHIANASPIIMGNEIVENSGYTAGGGVRASGSDSQPIIIENVIRDNRTYGPAGGYGGGVWAGPRVGGILAENDIIDNWAWNSGGGLCLWGSSMLVYHNRIGRNVADRDAGVYFHAEYNPTGIPVIQNNLIFENLADYMHGSGIRVYTGHAVIANNTIVDSHGGPWGDGYGIYVDADASAEIRNNIIAFNEDSGVVASGETVLDYNLVYGHHQADYSGGATPGPGSISVDPLFVDRENGDFRLQAGSPAIDAGDPDPAFNDQDGTRNDLGYTGGPLLDLTTDSLVLSAPFQQKLQEYGAATVRYFVDPRSSNTTVGLPHAFSGTGPWQERNAATGQWEERASLPRGYGSHCNVNEVTLAFVSKAVAHRMDWLDAAESWDQIQRGLQTLRSLQTSGDPLKYAHGNFHRAYATVVPSEGDRDSTVAEIKRTGEDVQAADDSALAYLNLLNLRGLAVDANVDVPNRQVVVDLISEILPDINLRRFVVNSAIVHEYRNGVPSALVWDRASTEGPLILAALLLSRQISVDEFYQIAGSLENHPVQWVSQESGTIPIEFPSYHSAMFMHALRAIHGMPITSAEFPGLSYFERSLKPVFKAHLDFARYHGLKALGTQVMTQPLAGYPLFELQSGEQVQFPGNEDGLMPVPGISLARATGPHALFVPLIRPRSLDFRDADLLFEWIVQYEADFFHEEGLGWEAAIPWTPDDTTHSWRASDGTTRYTDWGRPYEALNTAYSLLAIFDALNPDTPLASFNAEKTRIGYLARFFDTGEQLPRSLFEGPSLPVTLSRLTDQDPSADDLWYRLETTRDGPLIVEATFAGPPGSVELRLYDGGLSDAPLSISELLNGRHRVEWQGGAPGETYYLKLTGTNTDVDLDLANLKNAPSALTTPLVNTEVAVGQTYQVRWHGGDAQTSLRMRCLGPIGWQVLHHDLPGTAGGFDWDTSGTPPGWYCFATEVLRDGETTHSSSPAWVQVCRSGAGAMPLDLLGNTGGLAPQGRNGQIATAQDTPVRSEDPPDNDPDPDGYALAVAGLTPSRSGALPYAHQGRSLYWLRTGSPDTDVFDLPISDPLGKTDLDAVTVLVSPG